MGNLLGPNWKTTLSGLITGLFGFVVFSPETFQQWPWLISLAKYIAAGGFIAMGLVGKDSNVTGGTVATGDKLVGNPPATPVDPTKVVKGE